MKIHCIGDSHTSFFSGYNIIQPEYPAVGKSILRNIFTYRIGAPLAYNLCEVESKSKSYEKLFAILRSLNIHSDYILLSFGEIDCRAHLIKQAEIKGKEIREVVDDCVTRYLTVILKIKSLGFNVGVWNAIPTAIGVNNPFSEYPYYGDHVQRNQATFMFNERLVEYSRKHNFHFFGVFDMIVDDAWNTDDRYYFDKVHLSSLLLPYALKVIKTQSKILKFQNVDVLKVKIEYNLFLINRVLDRNMNYLNSFRNYYRKVIFKIKTNLK